jgi:uncharacterized protein YukJ
VPLNGYGVLRGKAIERRREGSADTPHFQIRVVDGDGVDFRIAVNVKSQSAPSDLLYLLEDDFRHPITTGLEALAPGWNSLPPSAPGDVNLDYVRGNLFDPALMRALPPDAAGPDNDLADVLDAHITRAIGDPSADLYAFGQRWGPENGISDKVFGFEPGNGVHDIHMNQGNDPSFAGDDGVWQDGGLVVHFPAALRWVGIFLAFQSQAWHTDDATGHAIEGPPTPPPAPPQPAGEPAAIRILAAMVNPVGPAPEHESVLLANASPSAVDLTGWRIADRLKRACPVPAVSLGPGELLQVPVTDPAQLSNQGGLITLLDPAGLKVAGVAYTGEQARQEGWTLTF